MLTASRYGLIGALVGVLAATALGSFTTVAVPIFFSGAARLLLAVLLVFLMVERNFKPAKPEDRSTFQHMGDTFRKGLHTIRLRPSLLAVLGVGLFYGLYSDGYDRLWIKHLLGRFDLPRLFGNNELAFFGVLEVVAVLLSILLTRWAEKRFDTGQPRTIGRLMLGITAGIAVSIAAFAWSPFLGLALALYLVANSLRDLASPLMAAWMNQRLDPDVRATVLSMIGQVDAVGQIAGGPAIGALGRVVSLPLAISLCGGLLAPALAFIRRANGQAQATQIRADEAS
jgi:DHA3 family tetracycline resistance protein-like MFS transporter